MISKIFICSALLIFNCCSIAQTLGVTGNEFVSRYKSYVISNRISNAAIEKIDGDKKISTIEITAGKNTTMMLKLENAGRGLEVATVLTITMTDGKRSTSQLEDGFKLLAASIAASTGMAYEKAIDLVVSMFADVRKNKEAHRTFKDMKISWLKQGGLGVWILVQPCELAEVPCK